MNEQVVDTRRIPVADGQILTVEMTQPFIDRLKQHFGIIETQPLEDEHVKGYVLGAVSTAVNKAELEELKDVTRPAADAKKLHRPRRRKKGSRG